MKKALISPLEPVYNYDDPPQRIGDRVAEVADAEFPVASPLFWVPTNGIGMKGFFISLRHPLLLLSLLPRQKGQR